MEVRDPRLRAIWQRASPPVIFRRAGSNPLLVRLPYSATNFDWLRGDKRHKPKWNTRYKCWETPVAWYDWLARRLLKRYSAVYLIQLYREQQKCAPACWNAEGLHCEYSCMGANHGTGHPGEGWREVSETFAFEWGPTKYACRLLVPATDG
jgi:hypothetical protein